MSTWTNIRDYVENGFSRVKSVIFDFFIPAFHLIEQNGGKVLTDAAMIGVEAAETTGGTGQEKFAAAVASVTATLLAEGVPLVKNAVHVAIEAAVAKLNAEKASGDAPAVGDAA